MNSPLKKIVISYNTAQYLYRLRFSTILGLLERQYKVIVIAPWDDYSQKLQDFGCEVYNIKMDNKGANLFADAMTLLEYRKLYHKLQPDLALHFTIKPNIYGTLAARSLGVPCINMVTGLGTAFVLDSWLTRIVEQLYKFSQTWPHKVFLQNMDDMRLFIDRGLVPKGKAELLPSSGINLENFAATPPAKNSAPIFLLIARMLKDKGVVELVEAARMIKARHSQVRFQLLGPLNVENRTAILPDQMDAWIQEGVIEYLGETHDVRPYIADSACVVLPSYYREGLPRSLLEACAMARPIITTDNVGCRDIVDDGENGYLCKVKDPVDLANKIERMLMLSSKQLADMGHKGREKMQREFDERIIVKRYIEVVEEAIRSDRDRTILN